MKTISKTILQWTKKDINLLFPNLNAHIKSSFYFLINSNLEIIFYHVHAENGMLTFIHSFQIDFYVLVVRSTVLPYKNVF